jgi:putative protease
MLRSLAMKPHSRTRRPVAADSEHRRRHRPEILAPAGDAECLGAALAAGADAVYFGLQEGFNARARAGNFSLAGLPDTVATIHRAGARAYLAVNTLLFEPELPFVERVLRRAVESGVDAIIVQDPAVALLARRVAPALEVHASTQMTVSSPEAAVFAQDLGVVRVVLPRELSVREIETFVRGTPLEVEVFVHGALCVSWSGQCLTSEAWGGRSANRGQCAQSCRMPYDLVVDGAVRDLGDVRYLLSPKDLAGARAVPALAALGVHGLKIEGRQKGAQYVSTAVAGYRRWVDAVARGATDADEQRLGEDLRAMSLAYTRGFGDGFLAGSDHQTLVEGRFPKHRGLYLGRVVRVGRREVEVDTARAGDRPWTGARALAERAGAPQGDVSAPLAALGARTDAAVGPAVAAVDLRSGMGVVFDAGHPEDKHEPGGPIFRIERRGQRTILGFGTPGPDLQRVALGQRVWVTSDPRPARNAERRTISAARAPIDLVVRGAAGEPLHVEARCGDIVASATSATAATPASGAGLDAAILRDKLGALGETPFVLARLDAPGLAPGLHVPVSELKALRRAIATQLASAGAGVTAQPPPRAAARLARSAPVPTERPGAAAFVAAATPDLVPLCRSESQLAAAIACGVGGVELDWMEMAGLARAVEQARAAGLRVTLATLRVQKPGEEGFDQRLARLAPDGVLVRHWGGLVHFARTRAGTGARADLHGDFSLNVTNSITARHVLDWGLATYTPAHDLDEAQLLAMLDHSPPERATIVLQHRMATFHTEHCVYSHLLSAGRDYRTCGRPCEQHEVGLRDHRGQVHPVIVDAGCRNTVFDATVQSAARLVPRLVERGVRRFRVEFVRETQAEAAAVLAAYGDLVAGRIDPETLLERLHVTSRQGVSAAPMRLLG